MHAKISGIRMSQKEKEQITDRFDRHRNGYVKISEIASILRGYHTTRSLNRRHTSNSDRKVRRLHELDVTIKCSILIRTSVDVLM